MSWTVKYLKAAKKDLVELSGNQKQIVLKAILKVSQNPLPNYLGGYGKPLGNKNGNDLAGLYKIKINSIGIRIVYKLIKVGEIMYIIVIGCRADYEVYDEAQRRKNKFNI